MAVKHSMAERESLISKYKISGLSIAKFAAQEGIPMSTFHTWISRQRKLPEAVNFLKVARRRPSEQETLPSPVISSHMLIEADNLRIHVHQGCHAATLVAVLQAVRVHGDRGQQ